MAGSRSLLLQRLNFKPQDLYAQEKEKEHIGTAFDYKAMQSL